MESLLRRRFWIVDCVAIALVAVCVAHAAAGVIAGATWGRGRPLAWPAPQLSRAGDAARAKAIDLIVRRNVFCSTCAPPAAVVPARQGELASTGARPTLLALRLVAIMFAPPPTDPRWSLAIIRDDDARTTALYMLRSTIRQATVDRIDETRVYLDFGGGRHEFLDLLAQPAPRASGQTPAPVLPNAKTGAAFRDGIRRTGEHQYEVRRSTLDAWLGDPSQLASEVRILPEIRDGRAAGVRLLGVRPEGPFAAIGLRSGDVLVAINGLEMNGLDQAMAAYIKLRNAGHVSLAVERNGQKINLEYAIR